MPKFTMPMSQDLVSYDEAARLLHVNRRTIERYVQRGELKKYIRAFPGRRGLRPVFVDKAQLLELRDRIEVKP